MSASSDTEHLRPEDVRVIDVGFRRSRENQGATARSVSPRTEAATSPRRCSKASSSRSEEEVAEPVPCPDDEVDAVADGKPPPVTARRRKEVADGYMASCGGPGGSTVIDQSGEVVAERQDEAEGGVGAGRSVVLLTPRGRARVQPLTMSRSPSRRPWLTRRARGRLRAVGQADNAPGECTQLGELKGAS